MAGFMDNINKGFATLNVKTSNFMESSKIRAAITNKETEIASIMKYVGETVYLNRSGFNISMVDQQLNEIKSRYDEIESLKKQMAELEAAERNITGGAVAGGEAKVFCQQCGAPNKAGGKFCEKCGTPLVN
ncbi:MAG: zinc ribbon domain-containing protein [Lachnospiraceae bacterium]|nr:zinc ribbon domain-containing protein [Lachnospiraceae bacterium]